jgi:hypothetical protein
MVEIFELKGVTAKILETNELWLGEGILVDELYMCYLL